MANQFVPLEEAAKLLGMSTEQLVSLRSEGAIRAFKDGTSWKFPQAEIDRLLAEQADEQADKSSGSLFGSDMQIEPLSDVNLDLGSSPSAMNILGEASGSDIQPLGASGDSEADLFLSTDSTAESSIDASADIGGPKSEPIFAPNDSAMPSDDALSLSSGSASDLESLNISDSAVDLVGDMQDDSDIDLSLDLGLAEDDPSDAMDIDLSLSEKALSDPSDIDLAGPDLDLDLGGSGPGDSDLGIAGDAPSDGGSDLNLAGGSAVLGGSDAATPGSAIGSGFSDDDDDDDLVIGGDDDEAILDSAGSDISVVGGSGINLMSPSDSGLSLESEPLDLAGSSISAIDLAAELSDPGGSGSGSGSGPGGSGSLVDFKADEEFQLSPGGLGLEADEDSASQVIEVEDSQAFGDAIEMGDGIGLGDDGGWGEADASLDDAGMSDDVAEIEAVDEEAEAIDEHAIVTRAAAPQVAVPGSAGYEIPFSIWNVLSLAGILVMLTAGGIISADLMRNLWSDGAGTAGVSSLTAAILDAMGMAS